MTEVNTFSALVDDALRRTQRPGRIADAISYGRQTLRECQVTALFARDMTEAQETASATPHLWTTPQEFRILRTARYNIATANNNFTYPDEKNPGKIQQGEEYYYYRGPTYFAFAGVAAGTVIDLAYYSYFKKLGYYVAASRPATFDLETDTWSYLSTYDIDATTRETARNLVSNWMLFDWYDLILEGTVAKIFKSVNDTRALSAFALFKSLQKDLKMGEPFASLEM